MFAPSIFCPICSQCPLSKTSYLYLQLCMSKVKNKQTLFASVEVRKLYGQEDNSVWSICDRYFTVLTKMLKLSGTLV